MAPATVPVYTNRSSGPELSLKVAVGGPLYLYFKVVKRNEEASDVSSSVAKKKMRTSKLLRKRFNE